MRDVDLLLTPPFRRRDDRALLALSGDLRLHRPKDLRRRRQILDLVAQHLDAPVRRRCIERTDDGRVDLVALLERAVELHSPDDASQRRLRQLGDREHVVRRAIRCEPWIGHLKINDAVDLQLRVVPRDADLRRHVERNFAEIVAIRDPVDKRHDEVEPRLQHCVKFSPALDHPRALLWHDANRLDDDDEDDDEQQEGEDG